MRYAPWRETDSSEGEEIRPWALSAVLLTLSARGCECECVAILLRYTSTISRRMLYSA